MPMATFKVIAARIIGLSLGLAVGGSILCPDLYLPEAKVRVSSIRYVDSRSVVVADRRKHDLTRNVTVEDLEFYDEHGTGYPTTIRMRACDKQTGECIDSRVLIRSGPEAAIFYKGIDYTLTTPDAPLTRSLLNLYDSALDHFAENSLCGRFFVPAYRSGSTIAKTYPLEHFCGI
jgi:hypothetical protein